MAQRKTLTTRQIEVLRWIGEGCPDGAMTESARPERITAGALRNRGLVTTKGRGPTWSAAITKAGLEYLARVDGPNPPTPRQPNRPASQVLIDELLAAGGTLRVPSKRSHLGAGQPDYKRRVAWAERKGQVPPGKRLLVTHLAGDLQIELIDAPEGTPLEARPVPVPERVSRLHPVVAKFRSEESRHEVTRSQLPRASRLLHALAVEAERRGYHIDGPDRNGFRQHGRPLWAGDQDGHLRIRVNDHSVVLRMHEAGMRRRKLYREPSSYDALIGSPRRRSWDHEEGAKGTLRISILAPHSRFSRPSSWSDTPEELLETQLPEVLMEVECRAAEERQRIVLEQQEAERRRQAWEAAIKEATAQYTEHLRAQVLDRQVDSWQRATAIRAFCDRIDATQPSSPEARQWSAWARAHADQIDPLMRPLAVPAAPESVSPEDLRPFLDEWDPYSSERSPRRSSLWS